MSGEYDRADNYALLEAEIERLRSAIEPFARVAATIPANWPDSCVLTYVEDRPGMWCPSYLFEGEAAGNPTVADWRRLASA